MIASSEDTGNRIFFQDSVVTLAARVLTFGLSAFAGIILARSLGPEGRGHVAVLILIPTFLTRIGGLSLGKAAIYRVGKKQIERASAFWATLFAAFVIGGILTALGWVIYRLDFSQVIFQGVSANEALLALLLVPPFLYIIYLGDIQRAFNHIRFFNWMVFQRFGLYTLMVAALLVLGRLSVLSALASTAIGLLLAIVVGFILLLHAEPSLRRFEAAAIRVSLLSLFSYGIQVHVMNVVSFLGYRFDIFLLKGLMDAEAVGYYTVAVSLSGMLWLLPDSVGAVLLPRVSQMEAKQSATFTPVVSRSLLALMVVIGAVAYILAKPITILLYTAEYLPSVAAFRVLLPGVVVFSIFKILGRELIGQGHALLASVPMGVSIVVSVGLNLLLIPRLGIVGAAWASTVSYIIATSIVILIYRRISGVPLTTILFWNREDIRLYRRLAHGVLRHLSFRLSEGDGE